MKSVDLDRHVWEGWRVRDFISDLKIAVRNIMEGKSWRPPFQNRNELKIWCMDNQMYYKKYIPEVVNYFCEKYNIK